MIHVNYAGVHEAEDRYKRVRRPKAAGEYAFLFFETPMYLTTEDAIKTADPGACIIYGPEDDQDYSAVRNFMQSYVIFTADKADIEKYHLPLGTPLIPENADYLRALLKQVETEFFSRDLMYQEALSHIMHQIFMLLARERHARELEEPEGTHLYRLFLSARFMMLSNCDREWASTNMCEMVSLSRSQFYKYYNDFFGVPPMTDLNRVRIEKAKMLLSDRELTVTEVAARCGYKSIQHFSRTFREHCGMSPMAYVKLRSSAT